MVSVLDSEAHFERKAKEAGITDPNVVVLKNRGFKTLSQVAYMVSQPGVPMPESDFATFCSTAPTLPASQLKKSAACAV